MRRGCHLVEESAQVFVEGFLALACETSVGDQIATAGLVGQDQGRSLRPAEFDELLHDELGQLLRGAPLVELQADRQHAFELLLQVAFAHRLFRLPDPACPSLFRPFQEDLPVEGHLVEVTAPQTLIAELGNLVKGYLMGPLQSAPGLVA